MLFRSLSYCPLSYGGRLSSVVDVHTKEGNMKEYHGSATIGLISGNLSLEGPIIKDRTAFQITLKDPTAAVIILAEPTPAAIASA